MNNIYDGVIRAKKGNIIMVELVQAITSTDIKMTKLTIEFERNHILKREKVCLWELVQFREDAVIDRFGRDLIMLDADKCFT